MPLVPTRKVLKELKRQAWALAFVEAKLNDVPLYYGIRIKQLTWDATSGLGGPVLVADVSQQPKHVTKQVVVPHIEYRRNQILHQLAEEWRRLNLQETVNGGT